MHTLVVPASSYSDQSLTGTIGQSEEETEELSKITLENKDIQLDINIREESWSSSQQVNFYTESTSSSEACLMEPTLWSCMFMILKDLV